MNTTEKIMECLDKKLSNYKQSVTTISKTKENEFIVNDTQMFNWDDVSKLYEGDDFSSVDGIYCFLENNVLRIYLFEFKNQNLHDPYFDAKKQLNYFLNDLEKCVFNCCYPKSLKEVKKNLVSKKIISLKTKPLESLILLHKILTEEGISHEDIVSIKKEYYIVSTTPISGNKSNWHRRGRNKEIFGFIDKIKPFPFVEVDHLSEKSFLSLIDELEIIVTNQTFIIDD